MAKDKSSLSLQGTVANAIKTGDPDHLAQVRSLIASRLRDSGTASRSVKAHLRALRRQLKAGKLPPDGNVHRRVTHAKAEQIDRDLDEVEIKLAELREDKDGAIRAKLFLTQKSLELLSGDLDLRRVLQGQLGSVFAVKWYFSQRRKRLKSLIQKAARFNMLRASPGGRVV